MSRLISASPKLRIFPTHRLSSFEKYRSKHLARKTRLVLSLHVLVYPYAAR